MILTKADLQYYIEEDARQASEPVCPSLHQRIVDRLFHNYNREFMVCLRKTEYYFNNRFQGGLIINMLYFIYSRRLTELRAKTGNEVPLNVSGPGLHLSHGKVVISSIARIGEHCKILSDVTIGGHGRYDVDGAPVLGDRVFVGSGAKIIGNITIADDVVIGANAVVLHSIDEPATTWAGNPARKVSDNGSWHYLNR